MRDTIGKILLWLQFLVPAALWAYFAGFRHGQKKVSSLKLDLAEKELEAKEKAYAQELDNDAADLKAREFVAKYTGANPKRNDR